MYDYIACLREGNQTYIHGVDNDPEAIGQLICDSFSIVPMAGHHPKDYLKEISDLIKKYDIDIFIPSSDEEVSLTADNYDFFANELNVKLPFGDPKLVEKISDKYFLLQTLQDNKLLNDPFFLVNGKDDLENALDKLQYPQQKIIAKPRFGRGSRGVFLFDDHVKQYTPFLDNRFCGTGNVDVFFDELKKRELPLKNYVIMPYYVGNFYDVDVVSDHGKVVDICIRKRQLKNEFSPTSTGHKITMKKEVIDYVEQLCSLLNVHGIFDLDIIEGEDFMVAIDAAFRFSGSVGASRVANHNMPGQLISLLENKKIVKRDVIDNTILRPFFTMQAISENNENIFL